MEFQRQLYAEKANPYLRLETSTPTETEQTIVELRKELGTLKKDYENLKAENAKKIEDLERKHRKEIENLKKERESKSYTENEEWLSEKRG